MTRSAPPSSLDLAAIRVSVILPAYNAERFLPRALASVQAQDWPGGLEIVIVDDCSTDGTARVIADLAAREPRITALSCPENRGPAGARNLALEAATGDWIAVLDADDAFAPARLSRLIARAEACGLDVIADLLLLYDLAAECPEPAERQFPASGALQRLAPRDVLRPDPQTGLDFGLLKPIFHRRLKTRGLLRYPEDLRHGEDCALYITLLRNSAAFGVLHEAHYLFSSRFGSVSGARSPGSVTDVDYRALATEARRLRAELDRQGALDAELAELLDARAETALQQNRRYGWTLLRRREWRYLWHWLRRDPENRTALLRVLLAKLGGQRGRPD